MELDAEDSVVRRGTRRLQWCLGRTSPSSIFDNTIVIYTSDRGCFLGGLISSGSASCGSHHSGALHDPLPRAISPGLRVRGKCRALTGHRC